MRAALLATCVAALTSTLLASPSAVGASASVPSQPGAFTGYAFDACQTPTQQQMDAWRTSSPFFAVGVYLAGDNRTCPTQQELTPTWVQTQTARGWRILPITVGPQAACYPGSAAVLIDDSRTGDYEAARIQGAREASRTATAGEAVGLPKGSTHWLDIEDFDPFQSDDCRRSMLRFLSGWTQRLHTLGYRSGLYSSAGAGITAVEGARRLSPDSYVLPDQLWFAHFDGKPTTSTSYLATDAWRRQRIHQYTGDVTATYGGVTLTVDRNWVDVGGGTRTPAVVSTCGVRVDFATYATLRHGATGTQVKALQCLLKKQGVYAGRIDGRYDAVTVRAVLRFQRRLPTLSDSGVTTPRTWTALLSAGSRPLLKVGVGSDAVRRLQRALNAADGARLSVTGIFDRRAGAAVRHYQQELAQPVTGVVTTTTWLALQQGRR